MSSLTNSPALAPGVPDFVRQARLRELRFLLGGLLLSILVGLAAVAGGSKALLLGLGVLAVPASLLLIWHRPKASMVIVLAAACLFELQPTEFADALTDRVPMFWNVNTIFQTYAGQNVKAIPFDPLELLLIVAGAASLLRALITHRLKIRGGDLLVPIGLYIACVVFGWVNGVASGGDFKLALMEVRPQFLFFLTYLMAVNLVREEKDLTPLLWTMVVCVGLKGILYTYRRYVTIAGLPLPDQGVGSHEEAFFFDCFAMLLLVLFLAGSHHRLQAVMLVLLPLVVMGNLACNRRAGTAAIAVGFLVLIPAAYAGLKGRRLLAGTFAVLTAILGPAYYFAFKNSDSAIAAPARAVRSHFDPDERDANSNAYRDAENIDLMTTMRTSPVVGYGYGRRMIHAVPIADISEQYEFWDLLPHNQILWVWMRLGTVGFIVFWLMIAAIVIRACLVLRADGASPTVRSAGLFTLLAVSMLLIFGLLDLQLSNKRNMLMTGIWVGVLAAAPCSAALGKGSRKEGAA